MCVGRGNSALPPLPPPSNSNSQSIDSVGIEQKSEVSMYNICVYVRLRLQKCYRPKEHIVCVALVNVREWKPKTEWWHGGVVLYWKGIRSLCVYICIMGMGMCRNCVYAVFGYRCVCVCCWWNELSVYALAKHRPYVIGKPHEKNSPNIVNKTHYHQRSFFVLVKVFFVCLCICVGMC